MDATETQLVLITARIGAAGMRPLTRANTDALRRDIAALVDLLDSVPANVVALR